MIYEIIPSNVSINEINPNLLPSPPRSSFHPEQVNIAHINARMQLIKKLAEAVIDPKMGEVQ